MKQMTRMKKSKPTETCHSLIVSALFLQERRDRVAASAGHSWLTHWVQRALIFPSPINPWTGTALDTE